MTSTIQDQIVIEPSELTGTHFNNAECKATVVVSAIDDDLAEGNHFTTIVHNVRNRINDEEIKLTDGSVLYAANVMVTIYDDDTPGVIVEETDGVTATAELDDAAEGVVGEVSYFQDEYILRLTRKPSGTVEVTIASFEVASDVDITTTPTGRYIAPTPTGRDFTSRTQVLVNGEESLIITFTPENWYLSVTIQVAAIDDDIEEGVDWLNFGSQPSNLALIQGPLIISAGYSLPLPQTAHPIMLQHESNPVDFIIPAGVEIDLTPEFVFEQNQVDTVVFNHQDVNATADTTIINSHILGVGMVDNLVFLGGGPFNGIIHDGLEILTFNFGEEDTVLYVNGTTEAIHIVNLSPTNRTSDDYVDVRNLSGPMLINGGMGQDIVNVSSTDERKVNAIRALLMFDGGEDDEITDVLFVDNSGDFDHVVNITRELVEMTSMIVPEEVSGDETNPIQPRDSYLITLRNATGGTFNFILNDPVTGAERVSSQIPYPPNITQIEYAIDEALVPDRKSCGSFSTSACASSARAMQLGNSDTYFIAFVGERLNTGVTLALNTSNLENYNEEIFLNATNNHVTMINSGVAYTNVDDLIVHLGQGNIVANIRGTTANHTYIESQSGDDKFFISSDANENTDTALSVEVLYGLLDYIEGDLHIEFNSGRHRLFLSDCFSVHPKGVGTNGFVEITNSSIMNLGDDLGNIYFSASNGTLSDDFTLW